jgi:hypothetical protein
MLRLVLGGVALAATGYGLKKYIEKNDKYYEMEDIGFKITDGIDAAAEKTDDFFNYLIEIVDSLGSDSSMETSKELNALDNIHKTKEKFYNESMPILLEVFSTIKNLPDYDMEQFYKLQQRFVKDDSEFYELDENTQEDLKNYLEVFSKGVDKLNELVEDRINSCEDVQTVDFATLSVDEQEEIENIYLIAVELIEFCYTQSIDKENNFSKKLSRQILVFKKIAQLDF